MAGLGHDPDHFVGFNHEERADPLLRHRLRRYLRQGCGDYLQGLAITGSLISRREWLS